MGCDLMQGYHISRPVLSTELDRWLNERMAQPAQ
jgi:EAL domain-containing protein (putative c-di-GMP-specific phosphodiesterase class I)